MKLKYIYLVLKRKNIFLEFDIYAIVVKNMLSFCWMKPLVRFIMNNYNLKRKWISGNIS